MLGIRKFNGVAIDLFQGDITTFFCDGQVDAKSFEESFKEASGRHIAVLAGGDLSSAMSLFATTKHMLLQKTGPKNLGRLTFIMTTLDEYRLFQKALFESFPELEE